MTAVAALATNAELRYELIVVPSRRVRPVHQVETRRWIKRERPFTLLSEACQRSIDGTGQGS